MNEQITLQIKLNEVFLHNKTKNPQYSLRAFAKKLDLSPGALSDIINGKKRASFKLARKIADKLLLDPEERADILSHYNEIILQKFKTGTKQKNEEDKFLKMSADQFKLIGDWSHYGILNLIKTENFRYDLEWIAKRLGITIKQVIDRLERLERLEMITKTPDGSIKRTTNKTRTPDDILNLSIQKAHIEELDLAKKSIERDPVKARDFTSVTLAIAPEKIPQAKEMIRKFQDELCDILGDGAKTEVYKICFQLFPITNVNQSLDKGDIQ